MTLTLIPRRRRIPSRRRRSCGTRRDRAQHLFSTVRSHFESTSFNIRFHCIEVYFIHRICSRPRYIRSHPLLHRPHGLLVGARGGHRRRSGHRDGLDAVLVCRGCRSGRSSRGCSRVLARRLEKPQLGSLRPLRSDGGHVQLDEWRWVSDGVSGRNALPPTASDRSSRDCGRPTEISR